MKTLSEIKTTALEKIYALTPAEAPIYETETLRSRHAYTIAALEDDEDTDEDLDEDLDDLETDDDMDDFDDTDMDDEDLDLELEEADDAADDDSDLA